MPIKTHQLAVPGTVAIKAFLAYSSQILFNRIDPGPLDSQQFLIFNLQILALLICYARVCTVDVSVASRWKNKESDSKASNDNSRTNQSRWCKKCQANKPPRAHHCRICNTCILKMDHHCPWTANCVGHRNIGHFVRYIFFSVMAMSYLEYFLFIRLAVLWNKRQWADYNGPSMLQLSHLLILCFSNSTALLGLFVLFIRSIICVGSNQTTIEEWEVERHESLLKRARRSGGFVNAPGGKRIKIERHEFPYDIGIFANISQCMGSNNPFVWLWPLAASPSRESGMTFDINDFNPSHLSWPPPDPDRMPMPIPTRDMSPMTITSSYDQKDIEAFKARQQADLRSRITARNDRQVPVESNMYAKSQEQDYDDDDNDNDDVEEEEAGWTNIEGERLADFGVDEDFEHDDNVPLAHLLKRQSPAGR